MAVVLAVPRSPSRNPEPTVLTSDGRVHRIGPADLQEPLRAVARVRIPKHFNARNTKSRKDLAATVRAQVPFDPPPPEDREEPAPPEQTEEVAALRAALRAHPCHDCPDREDHARWSERWWQLRRTTDDLQRRVSSRSNTVARTFDRICTLLAGQGYLSEDGDEVTPTGERLRRIYTEKDLVAAEALARGTWRRLDAAALAAVVSTLVYEPRGDDSPEPRWPVVEVEEAYREMVGIWSELTDREAEHRLPLTGAPDPGMVWVMHRWASGRALDEVLRDSEMTAGDFVRRSKQVIDLLGQLAQADDGPVGATAKRASRAVLRGVVAADRLD